LVAEGDHLYFNRQDITTEANNMVEDYLQGNFRGLGWRLGHSMDEASKPHDDKMFLY